MSTSTDDTLKALERHTRLSTVKVLYRDNTDLFWTGFVVGQINDVAIVLTTAHCYTNTEHQDDDFFLVSFYGENGPSRNYRAIIQYMRVESEILLLTVQLELGLTYPKLLFASESEWNVSPGDTLLAVSHPRMRAWRLSIGQKCSEDSYFRDVAADYDKDMLIFEHNLDLVTGSSGSALVNLNGHVVGLQSGEIIDKYQLVSGVPLLHAHDYAVANKCVVPNIQLDWRHVVSVPIHTCHLKYAVHIKYLDRIIRTKFSVDAQDQSLNGIIEAYIKTLIK
ncbi:unnamed protein product [Amaranthus hypochondriacus]